MLERIGREGNPSILLMRMQVVAATMENSLKIPRKTTNMAAMGSSSSIPGYIYGQNYNSKGYMQLYVQRSTIHNIQDMETIECLSTDEGINKMWCMYVCMCTYTCTLKWNVTYHKIG